MKTDEVFSLREYKSRMKKLQGKLRQKAKGGNYYYRLTIANGIRKEFALKTADEAVAIQRAEELDSIYAAPNIEVAVAQINAIKGFSKQAQMLPLTEGWAKYEVHPERATPHGSLLFVRESPKNLAFSIPVEIFQFVGPSHVLLSCLGRSSFGTSAQILALSGLGIPGRYARSIFQSR